MQLQAWTLAALLLLSLAGLASAGPYAYEGPSVERSPTLWTVAMQ